MGEKTITIEIDEQGNSSIELNGFQGKAAPSCALVSFHGSDQLVTDRAKREFHIESPAQHHPTRQISDTIRRLTNAGGMRRAAHEIRTDRPAGIPSGRKNETTDDGRRFKSSINRRAGRR